MKDKLKRIIEHYGINAQQRQFAEEVFELQEAITIARIIEFPCDFNITTEIADCMIMLKQFQEYYDITDKEINEEIEYKVNRQIERIEKGE